MLRLWRRPESARGLAARLGLGFLLAALATACGAWQRQPPHEVHALADVTASYLAVLETLRDEKYTIIDQDAAAHTVRVRSHVDESNPKRVSVIMLHVEGDKVYLSASGYLVRADGSTHHALISELAALDKTLNKKFHGTSQASDGRLLVIGPDTAQASAQPAAAAAPAGSLPNAWSEPASDPSVWGNGNFTCLPLKLADQEQTQLSLQLSNGETADVLLSLAHAPALCRSKSQCLVAEGCPALGIADAERVSRLAARLSKHEIGPLAKLFSRGQPIALVDLSKHGSIAQAMNEKR